MIRVALRGLMARKLRLVLSGIAIVLGVGFVAGSFILTDTISAVFDDIFANANQKVSVAIRECCHSSTKLSVPLPG